MDDYYEEVAREECAEKGIEPGSLVPDKPFLVEQDQPDQRQPERSVGAPFYIPGGPTTHWGGAGWNPWHNAGQGNKRAKLQGQGLNPDNWMWRMAKEAREREREIREAREGRLQDFSGERLTVRGEQYGPDEASKASIKGASDPEALKAEKGQQPTGLRVPVAEDTAGLYAHDETLRKQYKRATGSSVFEQSQLANGPVYAGQVIVETAAETAARKRKRAIQIKPGEYRGFYEVCMCHQVLKKNPLTSVYSPTQISPMSGKTSSQRRQIWKRRRSCLWWKRNAHASGGIQITRLPLP